MIKRRRKQKQIFHHTNTITIHKPHLVMIISPPLQNFSLKPGPTPRKKPGPNPETGNPSLNPSFHHSSSSSSSSSLSNPTANTIILLPHQNPPSLSLSLSLPSSPPMSLSLYRTKHRSLTNPSLLHHFSSSSSSIPPNDHFALEDAPNSQSNPPQQQQQQTSFSSYFSDVKASLKHQPEQNPQALNQGNRRNFPPLRNPTNPSPSFSKPTSRAASLEEIRKNLSEFRLRSSALNPTEPNSAPQSPPSLPSSSSQSQHTISFHELYKRNVLTKKEGGSDGTQSTRNSGNQYISFDAIRESLRQMRANQSANTDRRSGGGVANGSQFLAFKNRLNLKPMNENEPVKSTVIGGTEGLPMTVFGKEMAEGEGGVKGEMSTEFVKMYSHGELGEKLRILRPEVKKGEKGWFSLQELNERLRKLREMEERETESRIGGVLIKDLRESLVRLRMSDDEKTKKNYIQRLNLLGQLGTLQPPKEHLVEKYFHPDNLSSAEKLKIELSKVRDEFKMSESDCGSARVQVAQLTTKIKHLSSVLHKKDKHCRKGLKAMVQKRKKLLKYLRRTDWDSYCFVLSKLGLRDNPDYKN